MTFVRNHLGLVLPLFAILFALEYLMVFERAVTRYEESLKDQYRVIVVADRSVKPADLRNVDVLVAEAEPVDPKQVLQKIRRRITPESLKKLQSVIPSFYLLGLRTYPGSHRLEKLKKELLALPGVKEVQIFKKRHDRLYGMLLFMKSNLYLFSLLIGLIALLLIVKQMYIWQLEHKERMQIMAYFGAPVWLRSGVLFRLAFVDAFLAWLLTAGLTIYAFNDPTILALLRQMHIDPAAIWSLEDFGRLALVGFAIAFASAFWVVFRFREES